MKRTVARLLLLLISSSVHAARDTNSDGVITILLPLAFSSTQEMPGAHGSLWTTELWVHNASDVEIRSLQPTGNCFPPCGGLFPGSLGRWGGLISNHNDGGALLTIVASLADEVSFSSRLLERTRHSQPNGVDIPVVAEDEFHRTATTYLGIPAGNGVRSTLRVYDPRVKRGTAVIAEFLNSEGRVLATTVLRPGDDPVVIDGAPFTYPLPGAAAIHDMTAVIPELRGLESFHIRLRPVVQGTEYWAMVSVTDNATQHVLLITAQP